MLFAPVGVGVDPVGAVKKSATRSPSEISNIHLFGGGRPGALVNGRVVFGPRGDKWDIELWADNLFNQDYKQVAFDSPFQNVPTNKTGVLDAFLGAPRTYGVTFRAKY